MSVLSLPRPQQTAAFLRAVVADIAIVGAADLEVSDEGLVLMAYFDEALVKARAEQQGLLDRSPAAAAASERVQGLLRDTVEHHARRTGMDVARCVLLSASGRRLAAFDA